MYLEILLNTNDVFVVCVDVCMTEKGDSKVGRLGKESTRKFKSLQDPQTAFIQWMQSAGILHFQRESDSVRLVFLLIKVAASEKGPICPGSLLMALSFRLLQTQNSANYTKMEESPIFVLHI